MAGSPSIALSPHVRATAARMGTAYPMATASAGPVGWAKHATAWHARSSAARTARAQVACACAHTPGPASGATSTPLCASIPRADGLGVSALPTAHAHVPRAGRERAATSAIAQPGVSTVCARPRAPASAPAAGRVIDAIYRHARALRRVRSAAIACPRGPSTTILRRASATRGMAARRARCARAARAAVAHTARASTARAVARPAGRAPTAPSVDAVSRGAEAMDGACAARVGASVAGRAPRARRRSAPPDVLATAGASTAYASVQAAGAATTARSR